VADGAGSVSPARATLHIERLDDIATVGSVTPASVTAALDRVATFVEANVRFWNEYSDGLRTFMPTNGVVLPVSHELAEVHVDGFVGGGRAPGRGSPGTACWDRASFLH
jgi:hypothetical protein